MGAAFYVVLSRRIDYNTFINGQALAGAEEVLDSIATQLGVPPLMDFYSTNPDSLPDEVSQLVVAFKEEWFEPSAGLETVRALLTYLADNELDGLNTGAVMIDLKQLEQVLIRAQAQQVQWHLDVEY